MVSPAGMALSLMLLTIGVLVALAGLTGVAPAPKEKAVADDDTKDADNLTLRVALAVVGGLLTLFVTRWPVAAGYAALAGYFFPTFAAAKRKRREAIERVEAIATWTESLRDTMAASAGLQEALRTSARVAPLPIRREVQDLSLRLQHQTTTAALRRFAGDVRNPLADLVVASLILASSRHGGSLQSVLMMTAGAARDTAAMWRHVEAGRARIYAQARLAGWISFGMMLMLILTQDAFVLPYRSVLGQVVLFVVLGTFFLAGLAVYRLGRPVEPNRVFANIESWSLAPETRGAATP